MNDLLKLRLSALAGFALIAATIGVMLGMYQKVFTDFAHLTLESDRAGLLLDKGAAVRVSGVTIGEVTDAHVVDGDRVQIDLRVRRDQLHHVPADAEGVISATTVFGAKVVELTSPSGTTAPIADGATIRSGGVTTEANDVFRHGQRVLTAVDPLALNNTLTAMSTALEGRGEKLGRLITGSHEYLTAFNPHLDDLTSVIELSAPVLDTYGDVAADMIAAADQFGTTAQTIDAKQGDLRASLRAARRAAPAIGAFFEHVEVPLRVSTRDLRGTMEYVAKYNDVLTCSINGLAISSDRINKIFGGPGAPAAGLTAVAGFLPAHKSYTYPENLPKLMTNVKPQCQEPVKRADGKDLFRKVRFPDGTENAYHNDPGVQLGKPPVQIFTDSFEGFFGESGLKILIDQLLKEQGVEADGGEHQ